MIGEQDLKAAIVELKKVSESDFSQDNSLYDIVSRGKGGVPGKLENLSNELDSAEKLLDSWKYYHNHHISGESREIVNELIKDLKYADQYMHYLSTDSRGLRKNNNDIDTANTRSNSNRLEELMNEIKSGYEALGASLSNNPKEHSSLPKGVAEPLDKALEKYDNLMKDTKLKPTKEKEENKVIQR